MAVPNEFTDVVWLQTGFIGDIVLTTAAVRLLSQEKPDIRQHMITTQAGAEIFESVKAISRTFIFQKRSGFFNLGSFLKIRSSIKKIGLNRKTTLLFQVHRSPRSSLLSMMLGLKTATYLETPLRIHARWKVPRVAVFHETARIGMMLTSLGITREKILKAQPYLEKLPPDTQAPWSNWLAESGVGEVIAIAPGSVWGTKRWPSSYFGELVQKILASRKEARILLMGSSAEKSVAQEIRDLNPNSAKRIYDLVGVTTLKDLCLIFPQVKLLVANDSSPVHFASAFSIPTIALFGATIPEMGFGPTAPKSRSMGVELSCRPCSDHGPQTCPLVHFKCMKTLSVDSVFNACNATLSTKGY